MNSERKAVAAYLRDVARMIENGDAFEFECRWRSGTNVLANLHVVPIGAHKQEVFDQRKFETIPHVSEICMAVGSGLYKLNEELRTAESVVAGSIG